MMLFDFKHTLDEDKREITIHNLDSFFDEKEIEEMVNVGVMWEIFTSKYTFNLDDKEHTDLLEAFGFDLASTNNAEQKLIDKQKLDNKNARESNNTPSTPSNQPTR